MEKIFAQETSYILHTIGYPVCKEFAYMEQSGKLFSWKFCIA